MKAGWPKNIVCPSLFILCRKKPEMRGLTISLCHQNLSARVLGKRCSYTRSDYLVSGVIKFYSWKQIPTQLVSTKKWVCTGSESDVHRWKVNLVSFPLWR